MSGSGGGRSTAYVEEFLREQYDGDVAADATPGAFLKQLNDEYFLESERLYFQPVDAYGSETDGREQTPDEELQRYRDAPVGQLVDVLVDDTAWVTSLANHMVLEMGTDAIYVSAADRDDEAVFTYDDELLAKTDGHVLYDDVERIQSLYRVFCDRVAVKGRLENPLADSWPAE